MNLNSLIILLSYLAFSLFSGCSNTPKTIKEEKAVNLDPKIKLYAQLKDTKQGWIFTNISPTKRYIHNIELGTYKYLKSTYVHHKSCTRGIFGTTSGSCSKEDFFSSSPNATNLAIPIVWPLSLALTPIWFFQDDPSKYFFGIFSDQAFDWDKFKQAVKQARSHNDFNSKFPDTYHQYVTLFKSTQNPVITTNTEELKTDAQEKAALIRKEISEILHESFNGDIKLKIQDKSGLADTKALYDSINIKDFLSFEVKTIDAPLFDDADLEAYEPESTHIANISSSDSIEEFHQRLIKLELKLQEIKNINKEISKQNKLLAGPINTKNLQTYENFETQAEKRNAALTLLESASDDFLKNHTYVIEYPKQVGVRNGKIKTGSKAKITIKSKDFYNVRPQHYNNANKEISLSYDGYNLKITNKTNHFLTIEMISLYHRSSILSVGGGNAERYKEIPPNGVATFFISSFNIQNLDDDYPSLTKKAAKNTNISFGFAAKYFVGENNTRKTIYKQKPYNLFKMLTEQYSYL